MNKIFIAAIAAAFTLASCSSESDGPEGPRSQQILGHIEKGPFVQGSEVTLTDLNKDLSQSGKSYTTNTTSDLGSFDFGQTLDLSCGLVELKTSGYFYNECTGSLSNSQITLKAIANTDGAANLNVNLLTHLEYARVKYLVKSRKSFKQAKEQAESEILKSFAITDKIASPEKVSLTDCDKNANILLAISSIMLYDKSEAEFSEFIAKFSNDQLTKQEQQEQSFIGHIGHAIEPVFRPQGFDWKLDVAVVSGVGAKEIVASTMGILYTSDDAAEEGSEQAYRHLEHQMLADGITPLVAYSFLVFVLLYFPCIATIAAIKNETGSWKWAAFAATYTTLLAWVVSALIYQIGKLIV